MGFYYFLRLYMNYTFTKSFFLLIIGFYVFLKLNNCKTSIRIYTQILVSSLCLSMLNALIAMQISTIYFPLLLFFFFMTLFVLVKKQNIFSIPYGFVSIGLSFISYSLHALIITLICFVFTSDAVVTYVPYLAVITGILSSITIILLLRSKRIKKTLQLICSNNNIYMYAFLFFCIVLIVVIAQAKIQAIGNNNIYLIVLITIMFILLHIIRREIQKYYLSRLKKLELESLRQELAEKDAMIQKLKDSNDHLAHLVHQDNKLIPAMESAVQHYLTDAASTPETQLVKGQALAQELQRLAEDRQGNLTSYQSLRDLPHTGHAGVDAMLSHMQERALAQNIEYKLQIAADFSTAIDNQISEADLVHLLSDLIENAIIATKTCEHREIFISLGMPNGVPSIEVRDSGTPFSPSVYQDFGIEKHSTHMDDGGSGIGLMDIWSLKRNYAASLHIHEYAPETAPFTKRITLLFDRKNHYLIRTFRPQEILKCRARTDMYVLPLE